GYWLALWQAIPQASAGVRGAKKSHHWRWLKVFNLKRVATDCQFIHSRLFIEPRFKWKISKSHDASLDQVFDGLCRVGIAVVEKGVNRLKIMVRSTRVPHPHASG